MKPFREVLERYDGLWQQGENFIQAYFNSHDAGEEEDLVLPDLKELNTAITILKRIQDARRAIHLDYLKLQVEDENHHDPSLEMDHAEISRILRSLEQNGVAGTHAEADEEAV